MTSPLDSLGPPENLSQIDRELCKIGYLLQVGDPDAARQKIFVLLTARLTNSQLAQFALDCELPENVLRDLADEPSLPPPTTTGLG